MSDLLPEDKINARVKQLANHMHFDTAMSMALRMEWEDDRRELLAENQRLREALRRANALAHAPEYELSDALDEIDTITREALAGDAE